MTLKMIVTTTLFCLGMNLDILQSLGKYALAFHHGGDDSRQGFMLRTIGNLPAPFAPVDLSQLVTEKEDWMLDLDEWDKYVPFSQRTNTTTTENIIPEEDEQEEECLCKSTFNTAMDTLATWKMEAIEAVTAAYDYAMKEWIPSAQSDQPSGDDNTTNDVDDKDTTSDVEHSTLQSKTTTTTTTTTEKNVETTLQSKITSTSQATMEKHNESEEHSLRKSDVTRSRPHVVLKDEMDIPEWLKLDFWESFEAFCESIPKDDLPRFENGEVNELKILETFLWIKFAHSCVEADIHPLDALALIMLAGIAVLCILASCLGGSSRKTQEEEEEEAERERRRRRRQEEERRRQEIRFPPRQPMVYQPPPPVYQPSEDLFAREMRMEEAERRARLSPEERALEDEIMEELIMRD